MRHDWSDGLWPSRNTRWRQRTLEKSDIKGQDNHGRTSLTLSIDRLPWHYNARGRRSRTMAFQEASEAVQASFVDGSWSRANFFRQVRPALAPCHRASIKGPAPYAQRSLVGEARLATLPINTVLVPSQAVDSLRVPRSAISAQQLHAPRAGDCCDPSTWPGCGVRWMTRIRSSTLLSQALLAVRWGSEAGCSRGPVRSVRPCGPCMTVQLAPLSGRGPGTVGCVVAGLGRYGGRLLPKEASRALAAVPTDGVWFGRTYLVTRTSIPQGT
ncbi:hypothetical protein BD310DRAFT_287544 [Dichomitus squalens]|uniref:Uncharacterized protein n=1 Tax=Dichomitus squalens TaxID=114155 RepID=A0A4Q9QAX7_9APHY|nr:hypothetical protein BD310DRAFT_287544 [Dichomitus squalens]